MSWFLVIDLLNQVKFQHAEDILCFNIGNMSTISNIFDNVGAILFHLRTHGKKVCCSTLSIMFPVSYIYTSITIDSIYFTGRMKFISS